MIDVQLGLAPVRSIPTQSVKEEYSLLVQMPIRQDQIEVLPWAVATVRALGWHQQ